MKDTVLSGYKNPRLAVDDDNFRLDLRFSSEIGKNTGSAYVSGYLASVYLGYLDALSRGEFPVDENVNDNGSLAFVTTYFDWNRSAISEIYRIPEKGGRIESDESGTE